MMSSPTVLAADVSREFDGTMVIEGLDLSVDEGTIQGLIGPSGSGKTTTVRMLTGYPAGLLGNGGGLRTGAGFA